MKFQKQRGCNMQYKDENTLAKALKASPPMGAYLLYGAEGYLVDRYANKIAKGFSGGGGMFNLLELDGRGLDLESLLDAVYNLPLMADRKCVVVKDLDLSKLSASQQKELLLAVEELPDTCVLVVTGKDSFDPKSAAAKKLIAAMDKAGVCARLDGRDSAGLVSFLKAEAKRGRCEISTALCRRMLQVCDNDMHALRNQMAKVCAFAGEGEITREHVDRVITPKTEARVFDLGKAVLAGNAQRSLEILDDLFYLREQPVAILSALSMSYVDLYRARVAKDNGVSAGQAAAQLGYKGREFRIKNAFSACANLSAGFLRQTLEELARCDLRLKSTGLDGRVLLEQTVVRLLVLGEKAR